MTNHFAGKKIVIGVSGSIAAFKVAGWVSNLSKQEARVEVIMTDSACHFVTPLTFQSLSGNEVHTDMFSDSSQDAMMHIQLGQEADLFLIAPATANTIAKLAHGLADDLLTTTALVTRSQVVICPAMNPAMYSHPATQQNIEKLKKLGYLVVDPEVGLMACKDEGKGRLPEWDVLQEVLLRQLSKGDLRGKKVLVTAGPTREALDPARFISNRSSGKMGYNLAQAAWRRGADVVLVSGPSSLSTPYGVNRVMVESAAEMKEAVLENSDSADIIIKSAAVSDFKPAHYSSQKVKKKQGEGTTLELIRTEDILKGLGERKRKDQILVGFAAETENHLEEGRRKFIQKKLDLIAVNNIGGENTGFEVDTNKITLLSENETRELPFTSKEHCADLLLNSIHEIIQVKRVEDE